MKLKAYLSLIVLLQSLFWSSLVSAYSEITPPYLDVVKRSKNILVGTYVGYKVGKKSDDLITRYVFEDVSVVTRNKVKSRNEYSLQIPGGLRIEKSDEDASSLELVDVDELNDDSGVDTVKKNGKSKFYRRYGRDVMETLSNEGLPFKIEGSVGLLPNLVPGNRYIFIPRKNSPAPISSYIFVVKDERVYFNDMRPVVGFDEQNSPIGEFNLLNRLNEEAPVYTTDDGNPSVLLFSSEMELEASQHAVGMDDFFSRIRPMIGLNKKEK